jgi:hypothetical protein
MKPAINLCSAFRQGSSYAKSFFHQIKALTEVGYDLNSITVVVDGDTLTDASLIEAQTDPRVRFVFEGPRPAPTYFIDERSIAWARAGNLALEASLSTPSEFTLWVEPDLTFPCDIIELLMEPNQDIVAPIVMLGQIFYDSWGFRDLSGYRIFTLAKLQALPQGPGPLTELSSVGSCLLFRSSLLAQGVRLPSGYENGLLVGFCLAARSRGARVFCRHDVAIIHPTSLWASQVYRVTLCRVGNEKVWQELAPRAGNILAGPYFDFVIPEALETLRSNQSPVATGRSITFATNTRREIAILIGEGETRPPLPNGFGVIAPPQPMRVPAPLQGALTEDSVKSSPEELASKSNARPKRCGFWRRLERSIRKRRKKIQAAWNFDSAWYLEKYPEILEAGDEPLTHYINLGKGEGRKKNRSHEGIRTAIIRMVKTLRKTSLTTAPEITLKKIEGAFWLFALKHTSKHLEGLAKISARNRHYEFRLSEAFNNEKDIRILLKLPLGMQIISISFEDRYNVKKTVVSKFAKVSNAKRSSQDPKISLNYDRFVDLSAKPARATIWRQMETTFRNKRNKIFLLLMTKAKKEVLGGEKKSLACPLDLNRQANDIFQDIKRIHK